MKRITALVITIMLLAGASSPAFAGSSDYELAKQWTNKHCKGATIEKVNTTAKGGYKGKVNGTKYTVKYPKKVQKGKKVTVYMIEKKGDVRAMVCMGKVK